MELQLDGVRLIFQVGDLTQVTVDAIVNAANRTLMGGGGVDGAIHRAAGPQLLEACRDIRRQQLSNGYLDTATPVITSGFALPAKHVIHVVGPICGADPNPGVNLASTYSRCLLLADLHQLRSIAFPSISTGAFGCPVKWAAEIAVRAVLDVLPTCRYLEEARFVLFSQGDYEIYTKICLRQPEFFE